MKTQIIKWNGIGPNLMTIHSQLTSQFRKKENKIEKFLLELILNTNVKIPNVR